MRNHELCRLAETGCGSSGKCAEEQRSVPLAQKLKATQCAQVSPCILSGAWYAIIAGREPVPTTLLNAENVQLLLKIVFKLLTGRMPCTGPRSADQSQKCQFHLPITLGFVGSAGLQELIHIFCRLASASKGVPSNTSGSSLGGRDLPLDARCRLPVAKSITALSCVRP